MTSPVRYVSVHMWDILASCLYCGMYNIQIMFPPSVTSALFHLFQVPSIQSSLSFSLCICFLAEFLHSVKPWPPIQDSPYGPTAGLSPFFLSLSPFPTLSAFIHECMCVHVCTLMFPSFISVSLLPLAQPCLPASVASGAELVIE